MNGRNMIGILLLGVSMALLGLQVAVAKDTVARITKDELKSKLDDPNVVIVDIRHAKDWKASESKIKGAIRIDPDNVLSLADKYSQEKLFVFYCA